MLVVCKKCGVEHDIRDVNNGICIWCEQKERSEIYCTQMNYSFFCDVDKKRGSSYYAYSKRGKRGKR